MQSKRNQNLDSNQFEKKKYGKKVRIITDVLQALDFLRLLPEMIWMKKQTELKLKNATEEIGQNKQNIFRSNCQIE